MVLDFGTVAFYHVVVVVLVVTVVVVLVWVLSFGLPLSQLLLLM